MAYTFLSPLRGTIILINLCVLSDKNEKFNKFIIKILYMSFFFCTFAAGFLCAGVYVCASVHAMGKKEVHYLHKKSRREVVWKDKSMKTLNKI